MQAQEPFRARFSSSPATFAEPQLQSEPRLKVFPGPHKRIDLPEPGTAQRSVLDFVGTGKRVIEFGCGHGATSRILNDLGCQVTGIDVDASAVAAASSFCEETVVADIDATILAERFVAGSYDVAVFGEILEYLRNPWRALDEARALIGPGGYAVLVVPNVAHGAFRLNLLDGSFAAGPDGYLDRSHLRFFTLRSIREMCLTAGYRVDAVERTKVDLFAEHAAVPTVLEKNFSAEVIEKIKADPEHDTLAFVVKATPIPEHLRFEYAVGEILALERERDEALAAIVEARSTMAAEIERTLSRSSTSSDEVDKLELALRSARTRIKELEANVKLSKTEIKDLRAEYAAALEKFLTYAESELFAARTQAQELDAAIAAIKKSPFWFPKRLVQKLRRR